MGISETNYPTTSQSAEEEEGLQWEAQLDTTGHKLIANPSLEGQPANRRRMESTTREREELWHTQPSPSTTVVR